MVQFFDSMARASATSLAVAALAFGWILPAAADEWTNLTGTRTVSGEMIGMWNGRVLLRLDDGRRVSVRKEDLRAESRILAEKRFEEITKRMQQTRDQIRSIAARAEAPGPESLPDPPPAPRYDPPQPDEGLRLTLLAIRDQTLAGHPRVLYDTLPESHQKLLGEVFTTALAKLNIESYESARTALRDVAELIVTRQRWLFSHPRFTQVPEAQQATLIDAANLIRVATADDLLGLPSLRSRSLQETVALLDDRLSPHLFSLLNENSMMISTLSPDFEVESGEDGGMRAKTVMPMLGAGPAIPYTQVEGRWVAGEDASAATASLRETLKSLESIPDESLRLPPAADAVLQQVANAIATLQQASSRQQFHRALDEILPQIAAVVFEMSGFQPGQGPGGRTARGGRVAGEMTPEMEMEMEMEMQAELERQAEMEQEAELNEPADP